MGVPLNFSFRSAATVLEGVDRTFAVPTTWRGMVAARSPRRP